MVQFWAAHGAIGALVLKKQVWDVINTEESLVTVLMKRSELRDPLGGPMAEQGPLTHSFLEHTDWPTVRQT